MKTIKYCNITRHAFWLILMLPLVVGAQVLVAVDDVYYVPFNPFEGPLMAEPFGVMENDTLDGNNAGEEGATAALISGVSQGTLTCPGVGPGLCSDGSFEYQRIISDYSAGTEGFDGLDSFSYQLTSAGVAGPIATVTLSACTEGPVYACWKRSAYLAKLAELGLTTFYEGQQSAPWDVTRRLVTNPITPTEPSVDSMGIRWSSNHLATNFIVTSLFNDSKIGGSYIVYDPDHGFPTCLLTSSTCNPSICDVDFPPESCKPYDGISGSVIGSSGTLRALGVYIDDVYGGAGSAKIEIILDGVTIVDFPNSPSYFDGYFGVIDTRPAGFRNFMIRETSGKVGQTEPIFLNDFEIVLENAIVADGDLAPRGNPDGIINVADYLVAMQIILQLITPTADEILHGDLYPVGVGDGQITTSDLIQLLKLAL